MKDIKVIKVTGDKIKQLTEAVEKKQAFKASVQSGELNTLPKKGTRFV